MLSILMPLRKAAISICLFIFSVSAFCAQVDINTASAQEIASALKGIGIKKAQAIVEYREQHGDFASADDLLEVKGVGEKTLEKNRDDIQL